MKVVYVAGPFRAANVWHQEKNIRRAEELALEVWRIGAACICPHTNTRHYQGVLPDSVWLEGDIAIMKRCDAVVLLPDWAHSAGASAEYEAAQQAGMPVFTSLFSLKEWLDAQETDRRNKANPAPAVPVERRSTVDWTKRLDDLNADLEAKLHRNHRATASDLRKGVAIACPNGDDSEHHPKHPGKALSGLNGALICEVCRCELCLPTEDEQKAYDDAKAQRLAELNAALAEARTRRLNTGHGRVTPRPDGYVETCDGPGICPVCSREQYDDNFAKANAAVSAAATSNGA